MSGSSIVAQLPLWPESLLPPRKPRKQALWHTYWEQAEQQPACLAAGPTVQRYLDLLGPLHWSDLPDRDSHCRWRFPAIPVSALIGAALIKLEEPRPSFAKLHEFLVEHPGFIPLLGFPLVPAPQTPLGFNPRASLPTARHLTHMLRTVSNDTLQILLADSVRLIRAEMAAHHLPDPDCISLDTKHILARVKENNPKAYVKDRFDKTRQPAGDPDCRLGCKRRHNRTTPTRNAQPGSTVSVGEYYWCYGSGVVVAKVPTWGEFVIAEMTQPFDQGDTTYFFPLMRKTEERLGYRPRYATFDAAFDAWYVYAHFYREKDPDFGFAAVPFSEKGNYKAKERQFDPQGLPLCKAGLAMPLKFTFTDRTKSIIAHERGKYVCPLRFPARALRNCPAHNANWRRGGCTADMPTSIGARIRYTLDRESEQYKAVYNQRTACERINSQAVALGIERPHLRNGQAIANQNTLIYLVINLRFLRRLRQHQREAD